MTDSQPPEAEHVDPAEPGRPPEHLPDRLPTTSERMGAFTDAAVAIALTLLVLPLMEAVSEAAHEYPDGWSFLRDHNGELIAFAISFVIIAMFWSFHHRIFRADTPTSPALTAVNFAWLLMVVFLPVPTAMTSVFDDQTRTPPIYIGTMLVCSALLVALTHLELVARDRAGLSRPDRRLLAGPLAMTVLFAVALLLAFCVPSVNYLWLFVMCLTPVVRSLLIRLGVRDGRA